VKSTPRRRIIDNDYAPLGHACLRLLPETRVDGRSGKAPGHFEYVVAGDELAPVQYTDIDKSVIIEILGTQAAMPPSPTAAGPRFFLRDVPVVTSAGEILTPIVKLLATIGIVVKHWPSHGRHNFLLALAGFFARVGVSKDDALAALEEITLAAEGVIWNDCAPAVHDTYAEFEVGGAITSSLADALGKDVARRLRGWWINDVRDQVVDELNEIFFVAAVGANDMVGVDEPGEKVEFKSERSMRLRFANQSVRIGTTPRGKPIFKTKYEIWKQHPYRREYRKVVFAPPPYKCDQRDFNLWRGFAVRPMLPPTGDLARSSRQELRSWADRECKPRCALFLELTRDVICAGNEEHFLFLIDHLTQTVQLPGQPGGIAVVMKGIRGIGKGIWTNYFGRLFGHHFTTISKKEQILGKFNAAIAEMIAVFADEAFFAGDKASLGAMKTLITEPQLQIERKGIDPIPTPNFCHLFEATNEDWHTPAGFEERRFFALACSDVWKRTAPEKFEAVVEEMHNGGLEALLSYLLSRELTKERLRELRNPPRTEELDRQVYRTMEPHEQWWFQRLDDGRVAEVFGCGTDFLDEDDPWPARVAVESLYEDYIRYCDQRKLSRRIDVRHFKQVVLDDVLSDPERETTGLRRRTWRLVPLGVCRQRFDEKKGIATTWGEAAVPDPQPIVADRLQQPSLQVPAHMLEEVPFGDE
jgi:hypothetical protein